MQAAAVKTVILARLRARQERERAQGKLLNEEDDFHETVRAKLSGLNDTPQFWNFTRCGNEDFFRTCRECHTVEKLKYRCNIKWCPRCQWKITDTRKKVLKIWATKIQQPKHLVLTQKNFPILTRRRLRLHTLALAKIRRKKCFDDVRGGCVSIEITNEGKNWHLHSHWLLDARWLDMAKVSRAWGKLVGQSFAIVKVKDCRNTEYLQEVSKYVVEGSELAKWPANQINEFVRAVKGLRFFFSFGSLLKMAPSIRAELLSQKPPLKACECGCSDFIYEDATDHEVRQIMAMHRKKRF
jgi:Replication protein